MGLKNPSELATHQLTGFFYPRGFPKMFQILVEESMPPIGQLEYFQPSPSSQAQARTETDTWHCDICSRGNIARCQHWSSWTEKSSSDRICSFLGVQPAGNRGEKVIRSMKSAESTAVSLQSYLKQGFKVGRWITVSIPKLQRFWCI